MPRFMWRSKRLVVRMQKPFECRAGPLQSRTLQLCASTSGPGESARPFRLTDLHGHAWMQDILFCLAVYDVETPVVAVFESMKHSFASPMLKALLQADIILTGQ